MIVSHQISLAQDKQVLLGHMDDIKTINGKIDAAMIDSVQAKTQADILNEKYLNLSAGDVYTVRKMEEDMAEAVNASEESAMLVNRPTDDADLSKFDAALGSYQDLNLPIVTAAPRFDDDDTLPLPDDLVDQNDDNADTNPLPVVPVENGDSDEDDLPEINKDATDAESDRVVPVVLPVATRDASGNVDDPEVDTTTPDFGESRREEFIDNNRDGQFSHEQEVSDTSTESTSGDDVDDLPDIETGPTTHAPVIDDSLPSDGGNSSVQAEDRAQNAVDADDDLPDVPVSVTPAAAPRIAPASTVEADADFAVESPVNNFAGDRRDEFFAAPAETERVDTMTDPVTQEDAVVNADTADDITVEDTAVSDGDIEASTTTRSDSNVIDATAIAGGAVAGAAVAGAVRNEPEERTPRVDRNDDLANDRSRKTTQVNDVVDEEFDRIEAEVLADDDRIRAEREEFDRIEADVYADDDRIRSERREREATTLVDVSESGIDGRVDRMVDPEAVVTERVEVPNETPAERVVTETMVASATTGAAEVVADQPRVSRDAFTTENRIETSRSVESAVREIDNATIALKDNLNGANHPSARAIMGSADRASESAREIQQSMNNSMEKMSAAQQVISSPDATNEQIQEALRTLSTIERDMKTKSDELNSLTDRITKKFNDLDHYPSSIKDAASESIQTIQSHVETVNSQINSAREEAIVVAASRGLQPHMERMQQIENDSQHRLNKIDDNLKSVSASARAEVESSAHRASMSENEISRLAIQVRNTVEGTKNPMLVNVADHSVRAQKASHDVTEAMSKARKEIDQIQQSIKNGVMNEVELNAATSRLESISRDLNEQKNQLNRTIEESLHSARRSGTPTLVLDQVVTDINRLKDGTDSVSREITAMSASIDSFSRDLKVNINEREQVIVGRDAQIAQVFSEPTVAPVVDPVVTSASRITPSAPSRTEVPVSEPQRPSERVSTPEPTPAPRVDERASQSRTETPQRDTTAEESTRESASEPQRSSRPERGEVRAPRNKRVIETPSERSFTVDPEAPNDAHISDRSPESEETGIRQQESAPSRRKQKIDQRRSREDIATGDINTPQGQGSSTARRPVNEESARGSDSSERLSTQDNMGNRDFNAEFRRAKDDIGPKGFGESRRLAKIRREKNKKEG